MNSVNKEKKVLLLVEGEKLEVNLFNKIFQEYSLSLEYEIYPYKTNIYELYERMFEGFEKSLDELDLLLVLRSKDPASKIFNEDFSDILLVFDYEPQDHRYSPDRIKLMMEYFCESTDNGKLYINYPMIESIKHFKSFPDEEYINRKVELDLIKNYKEIVGKEAKITDIDKFTKNIFNEIINQNLKKSFFLLNNENLGEKVDYDIYLKLSFIEIVDKQNCFLNKDKMIYVLNTCLFFICDYNFKLIL